MHDIDPIVLKPDIISATGLSESTLWREQIAGRFPPFQQLSQRRVGLRLSTLNEWLNGRRDWHQRNAA